MRYAILIEKAENNYAAYVSDVPGCVATGATLAEVKQHIQEALLFHFEGMLEDSESIPQATTLCDYVNIEIPIQV
ncbi:type II toxin-antitoxin system HicB family antitoxin [Gloeocapsa sp. PCC 73106]|uniref:type II toxin-antitoxin system HicB family antitoxin n=1 Tax=Gloeocapsa sp. PCC 73106 TaxID=102232 RepID=UPI0002ABEAE7|nr:type II toxin-antitoxin system HicB family antitoxin [Gloeocapsa sp. PCC 73106]ELR99728.1 hypothetical protein GLO73106DRAFT_00035800 [Gloeocapsa sp. PCC 73106]